MGRNRGRQQKLRYQVLSVRQKCFETRLSHIVRHQFSVCEAETGAIVQACQDYLRLAQPGEREPLDLCLTVPQGRALRWKVAPDKVPCNTVVLSPLSEDDLDICMEQGPRSMQTARALRLIEQADRAACTIPLGLLASLVHQTSRTLTSRFRPFWHDNLYLPVLGVPGSSTGSTSRLARVLSGHIHNRQASKVRRDVVLSPAAHGRLLRTAVRVIKGYAGGTSPEDLVALHGLSPVEVDSTLTVMRSAERSKFTRQRLEALLCADTGPAVYKHPAPSPGQLRSTLEAHLIRRHAFSPTKAELLVEQVQESAREQHKSARTCGEIVFFAISQDEPAGKALSDCALVATRLAFYLPADDTVARGTMGDLKVRKAIRFATSARAQGALLCLPDLAFLLGMGVNSLQKAIARSNLFIPTRGTIMDIGRGVTHRVQIVRLYVQGYTEPQIVRRTNHTYDSVASYINDFSRVMVLVDQGLAPAHIRKVLRMSLRLVNDYITLYRQLDTKENQWKLNLMRNAAAEKKKDRRS